MPAKNPQDYYQGYRQKNLTWLRIQGADRARRFRARQRAALAQEKFPDDDRDVLRLAKAGYLDGEILELLDMTPSELEAALSRVAEYLAPSPRLVTSRFPFIDERYQEAS